MKYKNIIYAFLFPVVVQGSTSIRDAVSNTLLHNPDILSYQKNNKATKLYIDEAKGAYLPTVDLDLKYESENTHEKETETSDIDQGPEISLSVSQTIYDGSLNYNTVLEKKHDYKETFYKNKVKAEDVVLDAINAYLDLKQAEEEMKISRDNIKEHERILEIAKENEDISGEVIDRLQAESKTYTAFNNLKKQKENFEKAQSTYIKVVGVKPDGPICRPNIKEKLFPKSLEYAIDKSLQKNLEIKEQLEAIFKQRAILAQEKSRFLPTIEANFQASKDKDITTDDVTSTIYTSSISLSYNLFNGTQDINSYEREKIFLHESQKSLDSTTKSIEDEVTQAFTSYTISKEKIENLKEFVKLKKEILKIYQEQFEGGTRTVIDLLGEASELYNATRELISEEIQVIKYYYEMLSLFGDLSDVVLDDTKQVCKVEESEGLFEFAKEKDQLSLDEELAGLLGEDTLSEISSGNDSADSLGGLLDESNSNTDGISEFEEGETQKVDSTDNMVDNMLEKLLAEAYKNDEKDYLVVDDESVKIKPKVIGNDTFKEKFLGAHADYYTINVIAFGSMDKASQFIDENNMNNNSFAFQYGRNLNLFKVVYGVFETYTEAQNRLDMLSFPEKYYPIIEKIGKKQELYKKYNINYEPPMENIQEESADESLGVNDEENNTPTSYPPMENNSDFKELFLKANRENFTINVYTFLSDSLAKDFVKNNSLEDSALLFRFGKNKRLIKLVYGVYENIGEANKDLAKIKAIGENVYPVVEKIYKQRNVYKRFHNVEKKKPTTQNEVSPAKIDETIETKEEKDSLVEKKVEPIVEVEEVKDSKELLNSEFLNGSGKNYTINISTMSSIDKARWFVDKYKLSDDAIVYQFGENDKYTKIIYGVYKTYEEAANAMSTLDKDILNNKPYIDMINKHQELYYKYNQK